MADCLKKVLHGPVLQVPLPDGYMGRILSERMMQYREDIAFIDEYTQESIKYNELSCISHDLATALRNLNFRRDDRIAICSENNIYYFCPVLSAFYLGLITTPIFACYLEEELRHALFLTRPRIVFCSRNNFRKFIQLRRQMPFIEYVVILDFKAPEDDVDSLRTFIQRYGRNNAEVVRNLPVLHFDMDTQVAFVVFSSGTTGLPKGIMVTHKNIMTSIIHLNDPNFRLINPNDPVLCTMSFHHVFGLVTALGVLFAGARGQVFSRFEEGAFLNALERYRISLISLTPNLLILLAKSPLVERYDLSSLKEINYVVGSVSEETEQRIKERLDVSNVRQMYAMAETTSVATLVPAFTEKRGSVGKVVSTMAVMIRDPDTGENLGPNQTGEICFKGNLVMKGYYGNPAATREIFIEDGWMRTGDLGYFDDDEYLYIVDRLTEIIRYRGYQVPPAQLETLLLRHPAIRECGVVGIPNEEAGELPMAFVVRQSGAQITESDIIEYVAANVSAEKQLRGGVRFVNEIPKNASGKMLRRGLRMMVQQMYGT